jgi:N-acetylmuramoyl-L-alanine amidase
MHHIAIDMGHNCPPDTGAMGLKSEDFLVKEVGTTLINLLTKNEYEITVCNPNKAVSITDSLNKRCRAANRSNADYYVSIHFNAFNGRASGTECFAISPKGKALASAIVSRISALGFKNRGVKDGNHLFVIRNTSMPAVLVECCFIDSKEDMELLDLDKMAQAIYTGIIQMNKSTSDVLDE